MIRQVLAMALFSATVIAADPYVDPAVQSLQTDVEFEAALWVDAAPANAKRTAIDNRRLSRVYCDRLIGNLAFADLESAESYWLRRSLREGTKVREQCHPVAFARWAFWTTRRIQGLEQTLARRREVAAGLREQQSQGARPGTLNAGQTLWQEWRQRQNQIEAKRRAEAEASDPTRAVTAMTRNSMDETIGLLEAMCLAEAAH